MAQHQFVLFSVWVLLLAVGVLVNGAVDTDTSATTAAATQLTHDSSHIFKSMEPINNSNTNTTTCTSTLLENATSTATATSLMPPSDATPRTTAKDSSDPSSSYDHHMMFSCPDHTASLPRAQNDVGDYWSTYQDMDAATLADLHNFRERGYDYRAASFNEMQEMAWSFKSFYFGQALQSGNHVYESASGQGLNLLLTIEILEACCNITNLTIHGNDYLAESVHVAQRIYQQEQESYMAEAVERTGARPTEPWFHVGTFCQADSTNLSFVPSNSMDLAYTGFIDPLMTTVTQLIRETYSQDEADAIQNDEKWLEQVSEELLQALCESEDPKDVALANQMQKEQEEWHAKWVTELIRITKPGQFVIIEDVGYPACTLETEWGGVDTEWWYDAIEQYQWDAQVVDILEEDPFTWYINRYNVVLQKNPTAGGDKSVPGSETVE
ncbi:hypothetical protein ACA910_010344 [Epithemia clementina (nom. ined.)]